MKRLARPTLILGGLCIGHVVRDAPWPSVLVAMLGALLMILGVHLHYLATGRR